MESSVIENNSVERLAVEEVTPRPRLVHPQPVAPLPPSPTEEVKQPAAAGIVPIKIDQSRILVAILAVSRVVAVRLQLLLALIGAFVLALMAMAQQSYLGLSILGAYSILTVLPLVWLAWPDRQRGN
jgi:hypothetical protein